jgi:hypothetical protein
MPNRNDISTRLTTGQIGAAVAIGVVLWFLGARLVWCAGTAGWLTGAPLVWLYVAAIPGCWFTARGVQLALGLRPEQVLPAITLGSAAATMLDGTAMIWARELYGTSAEMVQPGAAWILWAAGWTFAGAYALGRERVDMPTTQPAVAASK